jgi:hypothetical protein
MRPKSQSPNTAAGRPSWNTKSRVPSVTFTATLHATTSANVSVHGQRSREARASHPIAYPGTMSNVRRPSGSWSHVVGSSADRNRYRPARAVSAQRCDHRKNGAREMGGAVRPSPASVAMGDANDSST